MTKSKITRRSFIHRSAAAVAGTWAISNLSAPAIASSANINSKLNLAFIGVWGQARATMNEMKDEKYLAFSDVKAQNLDSAGQLYPGAKHYADYRKMLEENEKNIDAVIVSTPDHTHAPASVMAMRMGKHCYCEKPLAHNLYECRLMQTISCEKKLVTQMGTQPNAYPNYYDVVELVKGGTIGTVREVYVWTKTGNTTGYVKGVGGDIEVGMPLGNGWGQTANQVLPPEQPVPEGLNWDLWVGSTPFVPYNKCYVPANWRRWWAFGSGQLGDFGCHFMNLPFWALDLTDCSTVEAWGPKVNPYACPESLKVKYTFRARRNFPACTFYWFDGNQIPEIDALLKKYNINNYGNGILFIGSRGLLYANYNKCELYPKDKFQGYTKPESWIPRSESHYKEFLEGCRNNDPSLTKCPFSYAGRLTETVLLGTVAYRSGKKLQWDPVNLTTNEPEANKFIKPAYRQGWEL